MEKQPNARVCFVCDIENPIWQWECIPARGQHPAPQPQPCIDLRSSARPPLR
jgi:hypothetical protein